MSVFQCIMWHYVFTSVFHHLISEMRESSVERVKLNWWSTWGSENSHFVRLENPWNASMKLDWNFSSNISASIRLLTYSFCYYFLHKLFYTLFYIMHYVFLLFLLSHDLAAHPLSLDHHCKNIKQFYSP